MKKTILTLFLLVSLSSCVSSCGINIHSDTRPRDTVSGCWYDVTGEIELDNAKVIDKAIASDPKVQHEMIKCVRTDMMGGRYRK